MDHGSDHVHPRQEERFEVLSGKLGLRVGGVERVLGEGEAITAPAGFAHAAWNASRTMKYTSWWISGRRSGPREP